MRTYPIEAKDHELIKNALQKLEANYQQGFYNHTVGCALLTKGGKVYYGVNCDGIHGSCAEYVTIGGAITAGERDFDTIVAVHLTEPNNVVSPCGNCRQLMYAYCPDIKVIVNDESGCLIKVLARDLLPYAWEPTGDKV
jgi:cytidine deaminase